MLPVLIAGGLIAVLLASSFYSYGAPPPGHSAPGPWFGWYPFGWFFFIPVFFVGFFCLRLFFLGGWGGWGWYQHGASFDPALETLRQRFAKGEITKEQYEQMKSGLWCLNDSVLPQA